MFEGRTGTHSLLIWDDLAFGTLTDLEAGKESSVDLLRGAGV